MGSIPRWKVRHSVLSILFITWIVSFMDRMVMSVAMPSIATDFHLNSWQSGLVMSVFFASYSISQIPGGILADIVGVRKVATISMLWWSVFTAITGAASNLTQMLLVRFIFGIGEGVFPACAFKTIAVWFPPKERATANAIKMAAGPLGAALSPLVVTGIMSFWGWRNVFYILILPGLLISALFWFFVPDRPSESKFIFQDELVEIETGHDKNINGSTKIKFNSIFKNPHIIKYFISLFAFDISYWGFNTWLPTYLVKARGFSMMQMGVAASLPFFAGTIGCIAGGWMSDRYFSNHRKIPIILMQLLSVFLLYITYSTNFVSVMMIGQTIAGFSLNFFITAFWALPMNTVPKQMMGIASGFINMAGQMAAFISPIAIGYLVGVAGGDYDLAFAFLIVSLLVSCLIVFTIPGKIQSFKEEPSGV